MNAINQKPIYESNLLGNSVKVFVDRVEYGILFNKHSIPVSQIASVYLGMTTGIFLEPSVVIETTGGKKIKIPTFKRKELQDAIYKAQGMINSSQGQNQSIADELTKLHNLKEKGIISEEEFEKQKNKLLG